MSLSNTLPSSELGKSSVASEAAPTVPIPPTFKRAGVARGIRGSPPIPPSCVTGYFTGTWTDWDPVYHEKFTWDCNNGETVRPNEDPDTRDERTIHGANTTVHLPGGGKILYERNVDEETELLEKWKIVKSQFELQEREQRRALSKSIQSGPDNTEGGDPTVFKGGPGPEDGWVFVE